MSFGDYWFKGIFVVVLCLFFGPSSVDDFENFFLNANVSSLTVRRGGIVFLLT